MARQGLANAPLVLATDAEHDLFLSATIAGRRLPFYLKRPHRRRLEKESFVEEEKALVLWPRTNREGVLCIGTQLVKWAAVGTLSGEHAFHALGKLTLVDFKNALLHLQIHPNAKSSLSKPFTLPLVASLALLERLPKGGGLEVWGELKPRSGRVVVTKARKVALPVSKGEVKPKRGVS